MSLENIPEKSQKLMNQVAYTVEKTGKKIADQVADIADAKGEEVTEETIQAAVDQALNVLEIAGKRVREKNISQEKVTLEVDISVINLVKLKITTDVPGKENID